MTVFAPFHGAAYLWRGYKLIGQQGLRRYVILPLTINIALFGGVIWYGAGQFSGFIDSLLPDWLEWLHWLLWPLFAITVLVAAFYTFSLVANLIASPFNNLLAAKVERQFAATPPAEQSLTFLTSLAHEVKKFLFLIAWAIPLGILFIIPGLNLLAPAAWLVFSAWMLALEYCDYAMANHGIPFEEQRRLLRGKTLLSLGFGSAVLVGTTIPLLNLFTMPAAVIGATLLWLERYADTAAGSIPPERQ